jgi:rSAM/selenodomain-associated transferase 2
VRRLSVIIPTLNEAAGIGTTLAALARMREYGAEVIVADGGSSDDTIARAQPLADRVLAAPRGRAAQMNAGAAAATGDVLLFLHADSRLPADADRLILAAVGAAAETWGRFDVAIEGRHPLLPVIAWFMNRRSRLTGIATGDQGLFVTRALFAAAGGYPPIALMEDVALSQALRARGAPRCLRERIVTSGRRWERHGVWRTMALMWRLRWAYWRGADPALLARRYERG